MAFSLRAASFALVPVALALVAMPCARAGEPPAAGAPSSEGGVAFEPGTPAWADVLAKAKAAGKPVFVDFTTDWCGWCRKLEKDTYSQKAVGDAMKAFVNVMVDAEKGEGPSIAKRFHVNGFPTLVVVDATGAEVDRIVGYRKPEPFLEEIARILRGEGTLPALRTKAEADPKDLGAALAYAEKLLDSDAAAAVALLEGPAAATVAKDASQDAARVLTLARAHEETGAADKALAGYERVAVEFAATDLASEALQRGAQLAQRKDPDTALAFFGKARAAAPSPKAKAAVDGMTYHLHLALAAKALAARADASSDDAAALNEVAWTVYEMRATMEMRRLVAKATTWARRACELSKDEPAHVDTLANLLALAGKLDEAIELERKAAERCDEPAMRAEFERNVAEWTARRDAMKARGAIPATPLVEPAPKPAPAPAPAPTQPTAPTPPAPGAGACGGGK